jgi:hypothetical protein
VQCSRLVRQLYAFAKDLLQPRVNGLTRSYESRLEGRSANKPSRWSTLTISDRLRLDQRPTRCVCMPCCVGLATTTVETSLIRLNIRNCLHSYIHEEYAPASTEIRSLHTLAVRTAHVLHMCIDSSRLWLSLGLCGTLTPRTVVLSRSCLQDSALKDWASLCGIECAPSMALSVALKYPACQHMAALSVLSGCCNL